MTNSVLNKVVMREQYPVVWLTYWFSSTVSFLPDGLGGQTKGVCTLGGQAPEEVKKQVCIQVADQVGATTIAMSSTVRMGGLMSFLS